MNLRQALYIRTIAQAGSITAAARQLYVSQPSLSQMLRQAEQELGLPIFDRSVSPVRLTYAGEKYLQAANTMLMANEQLQSQIREIKHEQSGRLRLGISVQRALQVLPWAVSVFSVQYPQVVLELVERGSGQLEQLVQSGQIDLALAATEPTATDLTYTLIEREIIGVLAGRDSPLTRRFPSGMPVTPEQLRGSAFVSLRPGHSARLVQDKLFRRHGLSPQILLETDSLELGKRVTLAAGACMLIPNIYIDQTVERQQGAYYPLAGYENHRHFYACTRKDAFMPQYARDLVQIVCDALAKR